VLGKWLAIFLALVQQFQHKSLLSSPFFVLATHQHFHWTLPQALGVSGTSFCLGA